MHLAYKVTVNGYEKIWNVYHAKLRQIASGGSRTTQQFGKKCSFFAELDTRWTFNDVFGVTEKLFKLLFQKCLTQKALYELNYFKL